MSDLSDYPLLSQDSDVLGGKTRIDGTRISVYNIWVNIPTQSDVPISKINEKYKHLSREQIRQAMNYAKENKGEMKEIAHDREQISRIFRYRTVICSCDKKFASIREFLDHDQEDPNNVHKVKEHHLERDIYCNTCERSFDSILSAIGHIDETEWHEIKEPLAVGKGTE